MISAQDLQEHIDSLKQQLAASAEKYKEHAQELDVKRANHNALEGALASATQLLQKAQPEAIEAVPVE